MSNSLLKDNNVNFVFPKIFTELIAMTSASKPPHIPDEASHLDPEARTRAWRAGVFLRLVLGPKEETEGVCLRDLVALEPDGDGPGSPSLGRPRLGRGALEEEAALAFSLTVGSL